ncbi:MAG: hypothetical protein JNM62_10630 [Flavobacteriales bacterium]|nr:hypothetical protein [Flavobacteriales bacterium]
MCHHIAYDIITEPDFDTGAAWLAGGFILAGLIWRQLQRSRDRERVDPPSRKGWTTPKVLIIFGSIIAVLGIGLMGWDTWRLKKAFRNGEARVVEGPIQSWSTERQRTARRDNYEYHTYESFYIGDSVWFGYRWEVGQGGFHNAGGELKLQNGMLARAHYLYADGADDPPRIVKLELTDGP